MWIYAHLLFMRTKLATVTLLMNEKLLLQRFGLFLFYRLSFLLQLLDYIETNDSCFFKSPLTPEETFGVLN